MIDKPNIFTYATSELSQDAFLCWFIEWANTHHQTSNPLLHKISTRFLHIIFNKHQIQFPSIDKITIHRQVENIDVLVAINDKYAIIIEDKTFSSQHSDQLAKYFKKINQKSSYQVILPIYYKTGNQSNFDPIYKDGYQVIKREEIIELFEACSIQKTNNDIAIDYYDHLLKIDETYNNYLRLPIQMWSRRSWQGFYTRLQLDLGGHWANVSNQRGGFVCFSWNVHTLNNCLLYIQLEVNHKSQEATLCLKIKVTGDENKSRLRNKWYKKVMENENTGDLVFKKPNTFGHGTHMTFAELDSDYRVCENSIINLQGTISVLKQAEIFLDQLVVEVNMMNKGS